MKLYKRLGFLALAGVVSALALMVTGCSDPEGGSNQNPNEVPVHVFAEAVDGSGAKIVAKSFAIAGDNLVVTTVAKVFLRKKTNGKFEELQVSAKAAEDGTTDVKIPAAEVAWVYGHAGGFVFVSYDGRKIVATNADGISMVGFRADDTKDGLANEQVTRIAVSGSTLVVAQNGANNRLIKLSPISVGAGWVAKNVQGFLGKDDKTDIGAHVAALTTSPNGDVFAVTENGAEVYQYKKNNLWIEAKGAPNESKAEALNNDLAFSKGAWNDAGDKGVMSIAVTKDDKVIFTLDSDKYVYGDLTGGTSLKVFPFPSGLNFMNFNNVVYAINDTGLHTIDPATGAIAPAAAFNKASVAANKTWLSAADKTKEYVLDSDVVGGFYTLSNKTVIIVTDQGVHVGTPGKALARK